MFLYISLVSLLLALIAFGVLQSKESESLKENLSVTTQARSVPKNDLQDTEKKLSMLVQNTKHISKVEIYNVKGIAGTEEVFDYVESEKPNFKYNRDFFFTSLFVDLLPSGSGDGVQWYVTTERRSFHTLSVFVLFSGLILNWILFSVWALKNAHYEKRLNVKWTLILVIFNIVGYLIYILANKNRTISNHNSWIAP